MKSNRQNLSLLVVLVVILFALGNAIAFVLGNSHPDISSLVRSIVFVAALYGWALVRVLGNKRFALPFLGFIDFVYAVGFVSNISVAMMKISGFALGAVVAMSILGIILSIFTFIAAKNVISTQSVAHSNN